MSRDFFILEVGNGSDQNWKPPRDGNFSGTEVTHG